MTQCLATHLLFLVLISRFVDCFYRHVDTTSQIQFTLGVVAMLDLHSGIGRDVDYLVERVLVCLHALLDEHVHVKGLVGLFLTVADTKLFGLTFGSKSITVNAVQVALAEEQIGEALLHVDFAFVERIGSPGHY